ncbi:S8 family serine peptidase [Sulfitobacter sp. 20_GPM-1509m]|uniref:S8 family serine peptidase n=1 Tax=Sulfitobacter sp. 20_GPM-1509m TaxID=1380367 RepID=UPI000685371B|nr:S8 family serine peptidase [Sulfitobacter sp. 20_GPM-1509m]
MLRAALALVIATFLLAAPLRAQQAVPWLLVPADSIATQTHLILTVPLDDPDALNAVAAGIEARFGVTLTAEWPLQSLAVHCLVVDTAGTPDLDALIARMQADAQIRTVQRMNDFQLFETLHSDPLLPMQSALRQINAAAAHRLSTGTGVRVGIVDTAIDRDHPDLEGRLADLRDFVGNAQGSAAEPHATAIAGIIAADADNGIGMMGVAPQAELIGLRACWQAQGEGGRCNSFSLARALNFAILNDVQVLNMSLGGPPDPLLQELIEAAEAAGIVVVAAWGENPDPTFPASMPGVIAASQGTEHQVPAPAVDVLSAAPDNDYRYVSGSSVAAAHVSGVVALLIARHHDITARDIALALDDAVVMQHDGPMVDACEALLAIETTASVCND